MSWIMTIRKANDNGRPVFGVGQVLGGVREGADTGKGVQEVQAPKAEGRASRSNSGDAAYNRDEEGLPLSYAGKKSGGTKLSDDAVGDCRRVVGEVGIKELAKRHGVAYHTMWNAVKGYTYKHLNHRYPPRYR